MEPETGCKKPFCPFRRLAAWTKEIKLLFLGLLLVVLGTIGASVLLHDGGNIDVMSITLPTQDGQWVVADLYKPVTATEADPAPCVVVCPGFQRSKETQENMSLELARRGIVVIVIDPYAQGDSSASYQTQSATYEGYGIIPVIEYICDTDLLNYIDKTKIGAAGHSAGGNAALRAAAYFGQEVIDGQVEKSRLSAIYVSGYVLTFTDAVLATVRSSVGTDYAYYDEGAFRNENAGTEGVRDADMTTMAESIRLVNSGLAQNGDDPVSSVTLGKLYGSPYNDTLRVVYNEETLHAFQVYDSRCTANLVNYFELVFDEEFSLPATDQTFMIKEGFNGLMLVGGFLFAFGFGGWLLTVPPFASLRHPLSSPSAQPRRKRLDSVIFWILFVISALVACFIFVPMAQTGQVWFATAESGIQTWFFPQRMTNAVLLWAVFNGLLGILLFFLVWFFRGRKQGQKLDGLKISLKDLGKTVLFALAVFGAFYALDGLCYKFFHVDFRFTFVSARNLGYAKMWLVYLMYLPFFFIFYLSNAIRSNLTMRPEGWSESKGTWIAALGNSVGLVLILLIQYGVYLATGQVAWTDEWLYVNLVFGLVPMMFLLPIVNRYFYRRTGSVYAGALVSCLIFILMTVANTVCYLPL